VRRIIKVLAIIGLASLLVAASVGCTKGYILQAVIASPKTVNLAPNAAQQLAITAGYDRGASINVTTGCTFRTGDATVATVTTTGIVKAIAAGSTSITVSYTENRVTKTITIPVTVK
jgi:hypothetical protein